MKKSEFNSQFGSKLENIIRSVRPTITTIERQHLQQDSVRLDGFTFSEENITKIIKDQQSLKSIGKATLGELEGKLVEAKDYLSKAFLLEKVITTYSSINLFCDGLRSIGGIAGYKYISDDFLSRTKILLLFSIFLLTAQKKVTDVVDFKEARCKILTLAQETCSYSEEGFSKEVLQAEINLHSSFLSSLNPDDHLKKYIELLKKNWGHELLQLRACQELIYFITQLGVPTNNEILMLIKEASELIYHRSSSNHSENIVEIRTRIINCLSFVAVHSVFCYEQNEDSFYLNQSLNFHRTIVSMVLKNPITLHETRTVRNRIPKELIRVAKVLFNKGQFEAAKTFVLFVNSLEHKDYIEASKELVDRLKSKRISIEYGEAFDFSPKKKPAEQKLEEEKQSHSSSSSEETKHEKPQDKPFIQVLPSPAQVLREEFQNQLTVIQALLFMSPKIAPLPQQPNDSQDKALSQIASIQAFFHLEIQRFKVSQGKLVGQLHDLKQEIASLQKKSIQEGISRSQATIATILKNESVVKKLQSQQDSTAAELSGVKTDHQRLVQELGKAQNKSQQGEEEIKQLKEKVSSQTIVAENASKDNQRLTRELVEAQNKLRLQEEEIQRLKDQVKNQTQAVVVESKQPDKEPAFYSVHMFASQQREFAFTQNNRNLLGSNGRLIAENNNLIVENYNLKDEVASLRAVLQQLTGPPILNSQGYRR